MAEKYCIFFKKLISLRTVFFLAFIIFCLLLARNPFNQRNLIPNFEPYPDSFHYLLPARSLVAGGPFKIIREGRITDPSVAPLYSITFLPFFAVKNDPRMAYFDNVILSLISLYILYLILKKLSKNPYIIGLTLFIFVTNYFIYWYPQWVMAENLFLPLFLLGVVLLILKTGVFNVIVSGMVGVSFYATKLSLAPLMLMYLGVYFIKLLFERKIVLSKKIFRILIFGVSTGISLGILTVYLSSIGTSSVFVSIVQVINKTTAITEPVATASSSAVVSGGGGLLFSLENMSINLPRYVKALLGGGDRLLWDSSPVFPGWIIILSLLGALVGLLRKKTFYLTFSLLFLYLGMVIFISSFYSFDLRYVYHLFPTTVIFFALFWVNFENIFRKLKLNKFLTPILIILLGVYLAGNFMRIKSQIMINYKYAETPWYYLSVLRLNDYFSNEKVSDNKQKPFVISPMPPYYIDFYSNGNYRLLPLDSQQEFRSRKESAWGNYDYHDLRGVYRKLLKEGNDLYVATYGLGNERFLHEAFNSLKDSFLLTEVYNGCYSQCQIFKISLR